MLTWFGYWLFMKAQINAVNIAGFAVSGGLFVAFQVIEIRKSIASKKVWTEIDYSEKREKTKVRKIQSTCSPKAELPIIMKVENEKPLEEPVTLQAKTVSTPKIEIITTEQTNEICIEEIAPQSTREPVNKKLQEETKETPQKTPQTPLKTNGCPKNLEYFNKKPKPIPIPNECLSCTKLITCVSAD